MPHRRFTFRRSVKTVFSVGWSDFVLKYHGSFLGYLWSLIGPVVKFLVIYYVTRPFVHEDIEHFPLYLFLGIIIYEHFCNTTNGCISMLLSKQSIISKMAFPRVLLVYMVGWTNMIVFFTYFLIYVGFCFYFGVYPTWAYVYMPIILVQMTLIALGVGMILSAYSLRFRDIEHMWSLVLYVLFWLTPIFYPYRLDGPIWESFKHKFINFDSPSMTWLFEMFIQFQPLSIVITDARRIALYPEILPSAKHFVVFTFICIPVFLLGLWVFKRRSQHFVQEY